MPCPGLHTFFCCCIFSRYKICFALFTGPLTVSRDYLSYFYELDTLMMMMMMKKVQQGRTVVIWWWLQSCIRSLGQEPYEYIAIVFVPIDFCFEKCDCVDCLFVCSSSGVEVNRNVSSHHMPGEVQRACQGWLAPNRSLYTSCASWLVSSPTYYKISEGKWVEMCVCVFDLLQVVYVK